MKKAVIATGGNQYLVTEGETIDIDLIKDAKKNIEFKVLLVLEDAKVSLGKPEVAGAKVTATVVEPEVKADKVTAIRYKAKKRVKKVHGHRQRYTRVKIDKIS
jgi:large subunit ribosomal protein L21